MRRTFYRFCTTDIIVLLIEPDQKIRKSQKTREQKYRKNKNDTKHIFH